MQLATKSHSIYMIKYFYDDILLKLRDDGNDELIKRVDSQCYLPRRRRESSSHSAFGARSKIIFCRPAYFPLYTVPSMRKPKILRIGLW